ncbi:Serine protease inhibitor dipetalogastin [Folsomia candida]|uniref:Serine protease inhibitor dipetalogastin n=1 Tax=Folsomia candida TaxID=158441 RepID=A0A226EVH6_FOLCA|nr:Serine protease inhibitor dipetalogastin [Folsomia candida]
MNPFPRISYPVESPWSANMSVLITSSLLCLVTGTIIGQTEARYANSDGENGYFDRNQRPKSCNECNCGANYQPFCGSNGVTYSNLCSLECAENCNPGLRIKFEGVCPVPYNWREEKVHHHQKGERRPVKSPAFYENNFPTTRRPFFPPSTPAPAPPPTRRTTLRSPTFKPTVNPRNLGNDRCIGCACTYDYTPICASDGVIYGNECQFRCAKNCYPGLTRQPPTQCWEWAESPTTSQRTFVPRPTTIPRRYRQYG